MRRIPGLWMLVAVMLVSVTLLASPVRITPVLSDGKVMATFAAPEVFSDAAHEAVQSGMVVTFSFTAELRRAATLWFDQTLAAADVASTVKLDTLTGAYQVSKLRDGKVHWSQQTQKAEEMRMWMTQFERVTLDDVDAVRGTGEYYIRVVARDSLPRGFSLWPFGRSSVSGRVELSAGR